MTQIPHLNNTNRSKTKCIERKAFGFKYATSFD